MYETMFELTNQLIQLYPSLTPFTIRRERFGEVAKLVRRINDRKYAATGAKGAVQVTYDDSGNKHVWREAGDDFHL